MVNPYTDTNLSEPGGLPSHPGILLSLLVIALTFFFLLMTGVIALIFINEKVLLILELSIIIPAFILVFAGGYPFRNVFRLHRVSLHTVGTTLIIATSAVILLDEVDRIVSMIFPMPELLLKEIEKTMTIHTFSDGVIVVLFAVIFAGLLEEMLFRGFLQQAFERKFEVPLSVFICSLVFSFIHLNPWTILQIIIIGSILGVMAWKSNSILPCALLHAINNGLAVVIINAPEEKAAWYLWHGHVHPVLLVLGFAGIFIGFRLFYAACDR